MTKATGFQIFLFLKSNHLLEVGEMARRRHALAEKPDALSPSLGTHRRRWMR